jgi:hypothetical protein
MTLDRSKPCAQRALMPVDRCFLVVADCPEGVKDNTLRCLWNGVVLAAKHEI